MTRAICFTGHRPNKLGGYADNNPVKLWVYRELRKIITKADDRGTEEFISGGALGVDQWAAEIVLHLNLPLTIARPFPSQHIKWPAESVAHFNDLCAGADRIINVSPDPYTAGKMQIRNEWMVDHSKGVIAVWDGKESGGTWNCIKYALSKDTPIYHINPVTKEAGLFRRKPCVVALYV